MCQERAYRKESPRCRAGLRRLLILLLCAGLAGMAAAAAPAIPKDAAVYDLEEISAIDAPEALRMELMVGAYTECQAKPDENVKAYPAFKSDKPFYGSIRIGNTGSGSQAEYRYAVAIDESAGTGQGYDRIYIDTNLNGDLTDDPFQTPAKDVPDKARIDSGGSGMEVFFKPVTLRVTPGEGPEHQVEVMPRLLVYAGNRSFVIFTALKARKGKIMIGSVEYTVVLGHSRSIAGPFDQPNTGLYLLPTNDSGSRPLASWSGGDRLKALHRLGGTFYRLAATPNGDKLFVWAYDGAFGTLEIKAGSRSVSKAKASGSLATQDIAISLTDRLDGPNAQPSDSYRLPVGDYAVEMLSVSYGPLNCLVLRNNHADGQSGGRAQEGPATYGIEIREDKPFVLDFSGKPAVLFAAPAKNHRVKRGDPLEVKAVLTDPQLDVMFRMVNKGGPLNPKVAIERANGEIVAEGVMPFG